MPGQATVDSLRRAAGNRVVARYLAGHRRPPAHPPPNLVQRLVGFEAELAVPSFGPPHNTLTYKTRPKKVAPGIKSFLDGGVPYNTDIGGAKAVKAGTAPFRLDADHSSAVSRNPIIEALTNEGHVEGKASEPRTNLEYVTRPIDDLARRSNTEVTGIAQAVIKHMTTTIAHAKSGDMHQLGAPAGGGYSTGVPLRDMNKWLKRRRHAGSNHEATTFMRNLKGDVYLQATVGVIPSGLQQFVADAIAPPPMPGVGVKVEAPTKARNLLFAAVDEEINRLKGRKWFKAALVDVDDVTQKALIGTLWLCFSYIVGDTLHQTSGGTSSVAKNAVPFLIKHAEDGAMAGAFARSGFTPSEELLKNIATLFTKSKYAKVSYWVKSGPQTAEGEGKLTKALKPRPKKKSLLKGTHKDFINYMLSDTAPVSGKFSIVTGKELPGYDVLPKTRAGVKIGEKTGLQKAIPLEYRWIKGRYSVDNVPLAMQKIVDNVRKANLSDLSPKDRKKVLKVVEK